MQRTIFIWDIHWCFDEFIALLEKIKYNVETDQLYLTGDLINKWPKAFELIDFLVKNPQIKSVIWNNEVNFLRYIKDREWWGNNEERLENLTDLTDLTNWNKNNLEEDYQKIKTGLQDSKNFNELIEKGLFDKKYEKENKLFNEYLKQFSKKHIEYLLNLPLYIETESWILLHWWLVPWKKLEEHHIDEITRIRDYNWKPWYEYYNWKKPIIYWHWAANWLSIKNNTIWLDSWCVYWKHLTAYIIRSDVEWWRNDGDWWNIELIQVSNKNVYCPIV